MTYEEYKALVKQLGFKLKDVLAAGDYSKDAAQRDSLRHGGIVKHRYLMLLIAYQYQHDLFLQRVAKHRDNKTLNSLLDELDSKAGISKEKEKLEQLFNPPSME